MAMALEIEGSLAGRKTAHEYVKDSLRHAILKGALAGGTRLVQADIATELQVSTTPVREALRDLATEGLIRLDPHRGAIVNQLSYEETAEIQQICKLLEPAALRQAALVITEATLLQAQALTEEMANESDLGRWADQHRRFHIVLIQDIQSRHLLEILRSLRDTAAIYVARALAARPMQMQAVNRDHEEFVRVLRAGDGAAAARLSKRHLDLTVKTIKAVYSEMAP
jgi:DNA-binding GntR family transcriptional regulator